MQSQSIFISSTTLGLKTYREIACNVVLAQGFRAEVEEHFETPGARILEVIKDKIDRSAGVICLVGGAFGGIAPVSTSEGMLLSYSQFEWFYAYKNRKPLLTLFAKAEALKWDVEAGDLASRQAAFVETILTKVEAWSEFSDPYSFAMIFARHRWAQWLRHE